MIAASVALLAGVSGVVLRWIGAERARATHAACAAGDAAACERSCRGGTAAHCVAWADGLGAGGAKDASARRDGYRRGCDAGIGAGCAALGRMVLEGRGGPKGAAAAAALFDRACGAGDDGACGALAGLLVRGEGVAKDGHRAALLDNSACEAGVGASCHAMALRHGSGEDAAKDDGKASDLFARACELGFPASCHVLALAFERDQPVVRGDLRLRYLHGRACDGGVAEACLAYGKLVDYAWVGQGSRSQKLGANAPLEREAIRAYRTACDHGAAEGCFRLAIAADDDRFAPLEPGLYVRACEAKYAPACLVAAERRRAGRPSKEDEGDAAHFLERGCDLGDTQGCYDFAEALRAGRGVERDPPRALGVFRKVCESQATDPTPIHRLAACQVAARMVEEGDGVVRDDDLAAKLFEAGHCARKEGKYVCEPSKAPRVRMGATSTSGRLAWGAIQAIFSRRIAQPTSRCFEQARVMNPEVRREKVPVRFVIGRDGRVARAEISASRVGEDTPSQRCVLRAIREVTFPQPEGAIVTVTWTLTAGPDDD